MPTRVGQQQNEGQHVVRFDSNSEFFILSTDAADAENQNGKVPMSAKSKTCCFVGLLLYLSLTADVVQTPCHAGVLLQAYYKRGDAGVPCPADPDSRVREFWWDHLARQASQLRDAGFTAVWLPPLTKGASGTFSVGFDEFDDYDLGSKNQRGTLPTRYGTREQLARCVAILRANGLDVYLDLVMNQRDGGNAKVYRYLDAIGNPQGGRFPKNPDNFHPNVPQDPGVFDDSSQFGDDLAPINGKPPGYVSAGLKDAADWTTRALDVQGYRFDDAKGVSTVFARDLFNHGTLRDKFVVGEFFDGDVGKVRGWIGDVQSRCSAFDFPLRLNFLQPMCNNAGFFDMSQLDHAGLSGVDPLHSVTWVENHDTDSNFLRIVKNKPQAYAYILTSEGYPSVFYKDYSTDPGCYGLKNVLVNLMWIHENLAAGPTQQRWKDHDVFAFERLGGRHLLVGLNNNGIAARAITVDSGFGPNTNLHDYTGHAPDIRTDGAAKASITIPKNEGGFGYVCYSAPGIQGGPHPVRHDVTQDYEGAPDLDIPAASDSGFVQIGRVYAASGTNLHGVLHYDSSSLAPASSLVLEIDNPGANPLVTKTYTKDTPPGDAIAAAVKNTGFLTIRIRSTNSPPGRPRHSYRFTVTYRAPETIVSELNGP